MRHWYQSHTHTLMNARCSQWLFFFPSFAALFSPSKRRQMEQNAADNTPRRPILGSRRTPDGKDEEDGR